VYTVYVLIHTGKGEGELTREKVRRAKPVENTNMTDRIYSKEVKKEQPSYRNLSATARRGLQCTYMPSCSFSERFFSYSHLTTYYTLIKNIIKFSS
jgi:hypothetical protein